MFTDHLCSRKCGMYMHLNAYLCVHLHVFSHVWDPYGFVAYR